LNSHHILMMRSSQQNRSGTWPFLIVAANVLLAVFASGETAQPAAAVSIPASCAQLIGNTGGLEGDNLEEKLLLCQLYESSTLLAQLGVLVSEGLDRLMVTQGVSPTSADSSPQLEKRKHEYLRFGKRKHEYLRFGKRKHEYLRFG